MNAPSRVTERRLIGFDVARALAFFGMVFVNFKIVGGAGGTGPAWLDEALGLLEGRAAATFVVLAGVGLSLMSARARTAGDTAGLRGQRRILLKRALFLFCVGLAYTPIWPADILHFYGVYIAIGALLLAAPAGRIWTIAAGFVLGFLVLLVLFDYEAGWNWQTLEYQDLWTLEGLTRHLFFNGFHPAVPWTAFLLLGMWLGRQDVASPACRRRLLLTGASVAVALEVGSRLALAIVEPLARGLDRATVGALLGTGPMPPMPQYMIAAGATAVVVIVSCLALADRVGATGWIQPLVATGQLALTNYVAHVIVGMGTLEAVGLLGNQTLPFTCAAALLFCLAAVAFSVLWRARWPRGPLEMLMRRLTDGVRA